MGNWGYNPYEWSCNPTSKWIWSVPNGFARLTHILGPSVRPYHRTNRSVFNAKSRESEINKDGWKMRKHTVDGGNPALPGMYKTL